MATTNLGRIGFVSKGAWSAGTYKNLDVVTYNNSLYICKVTSTTDAPTITSSWDLYVSDSGAAASASASAASAISAQNYALALSATSASSISIGTGTKVFTTQAGKQFLVGQSLKIVSISNINNYMVGSVISYAATTLTVDISTVSGSGTVTDWNILITGVRGATGATGIDLGNSTHITGIIKGNGTVVSQATVRTDYAEPTTMLMTGILKNTTSTGEHTIAVPGTDYQSPIGTIVGLIKGNGANALTTAGAETDYVTPTGMGVLSGKTVTGLKETKITMPANNIDLATGNIFSKTISGATTLTVSNVPASGTVATSILDLTNGGSAVITWWTGMKWASGTAPTLTSSGRDVLGFFTHDGGTTWNGTLIAKDVK